MSKLVTPSVRFQNSFLEAAGEYRMEFRETGNERVKRYADLDLEKLRDEGENVRHRLTPLLMKTGGHIGYDIRPSKRKQGYGKLILKLALEKAEELGIKDVLVTCDATNIGSKKVIETNGGKFESQVRGEPGKPDKLRYWITTKEDFA